MQIFKRLLARKWLIVAILGLSLVSLYFYRRQTQSSQPEYTTTSPEYRSISQTLEVSGIIDARAHVELHFPTVARLSWVGIAEGDWVKQWQTIASVDTRTLEKQLQQDFNTFEKQWRTHDQNLDDVDYYSPSGLTAEFKRIAEKSHFDLENTALNVEISDLAVRLSSLASPIDGLVIRIDSPFAGVNIAPTDIFEVVDPQSIYFLAVVDEEEISQVTHNLPVELVIDAYADETIAASVSAIKFTPTQSESGGTGYVVEVSFPVENSTLRYKLGMNGTARILLNSVENALSIPSDSLILRDGQAYVDVLENGLSTRIPVETGVDSTDYVEITSGLDPTDQVIVPDGEDS